MNKNKEVIRPATREDIDNFYATVKPRVERPPMPTVIAWIGELNDEPVGLGGLSRSDDARWVAFFDITDKARPFKKHIVRQAKMVMNEAKRRNIKYLYAFVDDNEPTALRFHRHLGFKPDPRSGFLMRWENDGGE